MKIRTKALLQDEVTAVERENGLLALESAIESVVLLKNDGALPIAKGSVALFGMGCVFTTKGGTGSGEVNERKSVTIAEGLEEVGMQISTYKWINELIDSVNAQSEQIKKRERRQIYSLNLSKIMEIMSGAGEQPKPIPVTQDHLTDDEACIYVVTRQAGEGGDRRLVKGDYYLTDEEVSDITLLAKSYKRFILLINSGGPIDLGALDGVQGINAIAFVCQLGSFGGSAVAKLLVGEYSPSGKLTDTWPLKYEDIPFACEFGKDCDHALEERYKEGLYVGYRYFSSFNKPVRYPFGYGLSYTRFNVEHVESRAFGSRVETTVCVTNVGEADGKEVVQLYLTPPRGKMDKERIKLVAFEKTRTLKAGESQTLKLTFDIFRFASYDQDKSSFILEGGVYILRVGSSSENARAAVRINLEGGFTVSRHKPVCKREAPVSSLRSDWAEDGDNQAIAELLLDLSGYSTKEYDYNLREEFCQKTKKTVEQLTDGQRIELVVGAGFFGGKKWFTLPGAVGNTTSRLIKKGIPNVTLCDGPAGLRIQKRSALKKSGAVKMVDSVLSIYDLLPGFIRAFLFGNPKKDKILYQFTTAFPVHTALGQTFNKQLLYRVGEGVGREMKQYGATFWLAPALNLHRNPLCGRNFEYFSEDPFLTGEMAAALCRGVQSHDGLIATVKHFACNNREDNRNYYSSEVDERVLRELYLPAFQAAINGGAKSVMTAYNKINGTYAPESTSLLTDLLRGEWGFNGVVMTDWFSTSSKKGCDGRAIAAGNDLIMPGGASYKNRLKRQLRKEYFTKEQLKLSCSRVLEAVFYSNVYKEIYKKEVASEGEKG